MNQGYIVLGLGVLGIVVGAAMYEIDFHRTIGLGGVGLGVVLALVGAWMARGAMKKAAAPAQTPQM